MAALVSGGEDCAHNAWSVFARPRETVVIDGALGPDDAVAALHGALARTPRRRWDLESTDLERTGMRPDGPEGTGMSCRLPPFDGGWIVALGYSLGACFERSARGQRRTGSSPVSSPPPHAVLLWCEDAWCLDHSDGSLHSVGSPPPLQEHAVPHPWRIEGFGADSCDDEYFAAVAHTIGLIRNGDAFQANIARRFSARFEGDVRSFAHRAISENRAWFGASLDLGSTGHVVSMSPELFLRVRPDGTVITRPIKGTRPSDVDPAELESSEKDAAELAMIVDLMRNDLGRVAEIGSVRVTTPRVLETHRTVHHGVGEVSARLRESIGWTELLQATFPPGSVTGAPKIRAMQIIDELERQPRGFYCGAIGFVSRSGHAALNVAIRTAQLGSADSTGATCLSYLAGCGIVSDSDPRSEVEETYAKTLAIAQLQGAGEP